MLRYKWETNIYYKRGDIVNLESFYVCALSHVSDEATTYHNIIYWIKLNNVLIVEESVNQFIFTEIIYEKTKEELNEEKKNKKFKRKIESIENDISVFKKKRKIEDTLDLKQEILLLNVDLETKIFLLGKYENLLKTSGSEYAKGYSWLKTVLNIPFKKYENLKISINDNHNQINEYLKKVRTHLDSKIHNMDHVKDEIIQFLARKIANPNGKGHVLALCGSAGTGKSKILKTLSEALELPFHQINFGGLNDVSILTGHSETYIGSKSGKLVEILSSARCMNPIIFLDEIDKISTNKNKEINGILTHMLDEEQNDKFQDNYLSNINIDLSKVFFVIAFNDIENVNSIVLNRMSVIHINDLTLQDKITIAVDKMIPDIISNLNILKDKYINLNRELIHYIIEYKVPEEKGVRQLKKCLEKIFNKINYLVLIGEHDKQKTLNIRIESGIDEINIKKEFIDNCLVFKKQDNMLSLHMYM